LPGLSHRQAGKRGEAMTNRDIDTEFNEAVKDVPLENALRIRR
jgi:hypothetical protein